MLVPSDYVELGIKNINTQNVIWFNNSTNSNIIIQLENNVVYLHMNFVSMHTFFFQQQFQNKSNNGQLKINLSSYNAEIVFKILSCLYGHQVQIQRNMIVQTYEVINMLQIQSLIKELCQEIEINFVEFDFFLVLRLAYRFHIKNLFKQCLQELENQEFQQMKYNRFDLFNCNIQLFKIVISHHNKIKEPEPFFGLSQHQIQAIIVEYCQSNFIDKKIIDNMKEQLANQENAAFSALKGDNLVCNPVIRKKVMTFHESYSQANLQQIHPLNEKTNKSNENQDNKQFTKAQQVKKDQQIYGLEFKIKKSGAIKTESIQIPSQQKSQKVISKQLQEMGIQQDKTKKQNDKMSFNIKQISQAVQIMQKNSPKDSFRQMEIMLGKIKSNITETEDQLKSLEQQMSNLERKQRKNKRQAQIIKIN